MPFGRKVRGNDVDVANGFGDVRRVGGDGRSWRTRDGKLWFEMSRGYGDDGGTVLILNREKGVMISESAEWRFNHSNSAIERLTGLLG